MLILGLTGSIGTGKTTTASLFRRAGVHVHDSDAVVHRLYRGEALADIEREFPGATEGGVVDRNILRQMALSDPRILSRLEALVHPLVMADRAKFCESVRAGGAKILVLDIPLLFETGCEREVDLVVVTHAELPVQKSRVLSRPGMTLEAFQAILKKQMPAEEKRRRAHFLIETGHGIPFASRQVDALLRALAGVSAS